jgi:glycosyltransferase involved in cell wall biosynthesis
VAAARATALPETAGDAAAYFDPLDVAEMAAALRRVLDDRELRARLARGGQATAKRFELASAVGGLRDLFRHGPEVA